MRRIEAWVHEEGSERKGDGDITSSPDMGEWHIGAESRRVAWVWD